VSGSPQLFQTTLSTEAMYVRRGFKTQFAVTLFTGKVQPVDTSGKSELAIRQVNHTGLEMWYLVLVVVLASCVVVAMLSFHCRNLSVLVRLPVLRSRNSRLKL